MATAYVVSFEHGKRKTRQGYTDRAPKIKHLVLTKYGTYTVCNRHVKDNTLWSFSTASFATDLEAYLHHVSCECCLAWIHQRHYDGNDSVNNEAMAQHKAV